ncbi:M23 family metallopeptidase [Muribaculum intestinale]|nr:M23 family metallopeptidase [Muribaculum intestinale]
MLSDTSSELTVVSPPRNATVTSPGSATIIATSYSPSGLWAVTLQHTNGYVTIIDGLSSCRVKAGDSVSVGESLGNAGTSHDVTIQLWSAGTRLNPLRVMPI